MMKRTLHTAIWPLLLFAASAAMSESIFPELQVAVDRDNAVYHLNASFTTTLSKCAAYHYLTDYEAAANLPGVIESIVTRESANTVRVRRTADERVLFFHVRLRSVLEYTESPEEHLTFRQLQGDSKSFQGRWDIAANDQGSTLSFQGIWEPDTYIPLFVIDYFAKSKLADKFTAIARLAEQRKEVASTGCMN
jgi:hypothetical protein